MGALIQSGAAAWFARPRGLSRWAGASSEGIAAVDALVALAILAATLGMTLRAVDTARRTSTLAVETREADVTLRRILDQPARTLGLSSGHTPAFDWKSTVAPSGQSAASGVRVCSRLVELTGVRDGRRFKAESVVFCPRVQP